MYDFDVVSGPSSEAPKAEPPDRPAGGPELQRPDLGTDAEPAVSADEGRAEERRHS